MRYPRIALVLAAATLAACGRGATEQPLADDLQRDLDMAGGTAVELAPRSGAQQVVSAIEATPAGQKPQAVSRAPGPKPTPRAPQQAAAPVVAAADAAPTPEATTPAPEPAPVPKAQSTDEAPVVAPRPTAPQPQRKAPRGGWWGTGDVIRNAPFPVNP